MAISILNFGAGVNSTALIIELVKRQQKPDYVIFADTGAELPETYKHIQIMQEWFKTNGVVFLIVKSKYECSIYDYYYNKKTIPWRKFRDCTDKFKITPITNFIKKFKELGVIQYIGIDIGEIRRAKKSGTKWIEFKYPLIDWKMNRQDCINTIKQENIDVPIKSGCYICPFQPFKSWISLLKTHPELFIKARQLEENNRSYPRIVLPFNHNLKMIEIANRQQKTLYEFDVSEICGGYCMT